MGRRVAIALALGVSVAGMAGCGSSGDAAANEATQQRASVTDISNVVELRGVFNDDPGKPRLLLILSPT